MAGQDVEFASEEHFYNIRYIMFGLLATSLLQSLDDRGESIVGSLEVLNVLELVIADAPIKVEAVAHGVGRFLGSVDQLFDELGIDAWLWCVVHDEKGEGAKKTARSPSPEHSCKQCQK